MISLHVAPIWMPNGYHLSVYTSLVGFDDKIFISGYMKACGLDLLRGSLVGADDFFELLGLYLVSRLSATSYRVTETPNR